MTNIKQVSPAKYSRVKFNPKSIKLYNQNGFIIPYIGRRYEFPEPYGYLLNGFMYRMVETPEDTFCVRTKVVPALYVLPMDNHGAAYEKTIRHNNRKIYSQFEVNNER